MLSTPHQKFCECIVAGFSRTAAYSAAFPSASTATARSHGSTLLRKPHIMAEIARLRGNAADTAGPALLSTVEKRAFLARVMRAASDEDADGDTPVITVRDRLAAIKLDMELAPDEVQETEAQKELAAFHDIIRRVRSKPWRPGTASQSPSSQHGERSQADDPGTAGRDAGK